MKTSLEKLEFQVLEAPDVGRIKMSDKDDQITKHYNKKNSLVAWSSLSKILIAPTSGGLEHLK